MKVIFTRGLQASGKSYWAKQFVKENQNYKRVSRDDLRHMLSNYTYDKNNENLITQIEEIIIKKLIENNFNIIIDAMHLNIAYIEKWKKIISNFYYYINDNNKNNNIVFEIKNFPISLEEAIIRDSLRDFQIGEKVIRETWEKYKNELIEMLEEDKRTNFPFNPKLPSAILVDIDGTLAIRGNRSPYDFLKVGEDKVNEPIKNLVNILSSNPYNYKVIIFSGRDDSCFDITRNWLIKNQINFDYLHMRKTNDRRKDSIVKKEMFNTWIKDQYNILYVLDDRKQVVDMWRELGLIVLDVAGHEF